MKNNNKDNQIFMSGPSISIEDEKIVIDALRNGWYGSKAYEYVEKFEYEFASYHNRKFALMTTNCTSAIHLALLSINVNKEDEVIVPDCTWIGSSSAIKYIGAETKFADIDRDNWCISAETLEARISNKTKAVVVVNLYGNMPNYNELEKLCKTKSIHIIEDAAESLGSIYEGRKSGNFGTFSVFSFHRSKTLTTGEGGMLLTDDLEFYKRCKFLRDHGRQPGTYYNTEIAYKYMPFNLQAALGYAQLKRIDELVSRKREIWQLYKEKLSDVPNLFFNIEPENTFNSVWSTTCVLGDQYEIDSSHIIEKLSDYNLPARPFFYPLSSLPAYNEKKEYEKINNVSYSISKKGFNLPCALNITNDQINTYCETLKQIILD